MSLMPLQASAGGITLGGTRVIYPIGSKQVNISIRNTSQESHFLVQSWIENENEQKSSDFFITPPVYASAPGNENILRLIKTVEPKHTDRETLYYLNTKAIPSIDKKKMEGKNMLVLAAVTRIKLFLRPAGLTPSVDKAPEELTFYLENNAVRINNPTPYYITLAQIYIDGKPLPDAMVSPHDSLTLPAVAALRGNVSFRTINDYGAITPIKYTVLK
ncbi:fimbria/pilus periplasmic chaperone [Providencia rettgeri]|uniref:fimbria/pilus periplasmic chaperone n=1 Tax=Providencia rettgeri TaxID=587 RepID=UPI001EF79E1F